ncbi:unnamed protein product [Rotaria sordida]|uniref:Uncharacterized protein n=2 Tax=Rotaria sordida TaxID=392033 RepID=A0A814U3F5_9BILA|nr:unnamed protein product [Rotaria sordida]CAF1169383.1 unnamed protein product [Rotaria sordida]
MSSLKNYLINLNIFESSTDSTTTDEEKEYQRRLNIIATRIFFIVFIIVLVGLTSIMKTRNRNILITIENPSEDQYINLPFDAHCPCSRISLSYGEFISIQTRFHQICSSDFISDRWIKTINFGSNTTYFSAYDFRTEGSAIFQSLESFCRLSKDYAIQSIDSFNKDLFISQEVLKESVFRSQTNVIIHQFQLSSPIELLTELELIEKMIAGNRILSALQTNFMQLYTPWFYNVVQIWMRNRAFRVAQHSTCSCRARIDCNMESTIFDIFESSDFEHYPPTGQILMIIPGMVHSCLPVNTILLSTLECFYNQTCLNDLVSLLPTTGTFTAMPQFEQSRYELNSTIQTIIDNLMIEEWVPNISYKKYYEQCAPISCTYFKNEKYDWKFVLTQSIGLLGSIIMVCSIIIENLVKFILRQPSQNTESISYLQQKTIHQPSEFQFKELDKIYSSNLYCPCSTVSMNYSTFMTIEPYFHQVCSSDLISDAWINYLSGSSLMNDFLPIFNYETSGVFHFQLLSMLCQHAQQTVNISIKTFLQTQFLSSQVISQNQFEAKINSSINDWKSRTIEQFLQTIKIFQVVSHGNQLMSEQFRYFVNNIDSNYTKIYLDVQEYFNCSCTLSSSCLIPMVPNFFLGCSQIEGLMKSTLECFYNLSCMIEIDRDLIFSLGSSFNFSNLNENLNPPNETIESILNKLMIDSWTWNISFSSYYNTGSPSSCTYEYISRNDLFFIITTILGIFGGLSLGLKLLTLIILRFIEKIINNNSFNEFITMIKNLFVCNTEQRLINRLHFVSLLLILSLIFIFSAFKSKSVTVQIKKPSLSNYKNLLKDHSYSLQCSCSQISFPYETFLNIEPHFHDLCSSQFISNEWINYIYGEGHLSRRFSFNDYRYSAPGQFILLSSLCKLSQDKVNHTISHLLTSYFINSQLLSENLLIEQIKIILNQLQSTTSNSFLNILNLIREIIGSNMMMSAWSTNWEYVSQIESTSTSSIARTAPLSYSECNCGLSFKCTQSSGDMMSGCYPLESILQTKLYCFYDQNCIDSNGNFRSLNMSTLEKSQFNLNSTIKSILNNLMIEEYKSNLSYENYFNQCQPLSCSYSYIKTHDLAQTIISLISLYGGLVIITRCLAIIFVKIYQHKKNRINPEVLQQNI